MPSITSDRCEDGAAFTHQLGHRFPVARTLHHGGTDEGHRLRVVQPQAARFTALGKQGGSEDQQLVFFARG